MHRAGFFALSLVLLTLASAAAHAEQPLTFNRDIRPILAEACFTCHGFDAAAREANLRLDIAEGAFADLGGHRAIVPGQPEQSEAFVRITAERGADRMPPPDHHRQLSEQEIETLRRWIGQGAGYEDHWAFIAPERPALPEVSDESWPANAIDHFILARLDGENLQPSEPADRRTLIRRVTLDLTGLPPTPEEVEAFVNDDRPGAYTRVVDRLLASPRYGEHMAWIWLDAARYADTSGYQADVTQNQWPWRDWVVDAINANMPYDRFTVEQLAGDLLENPTREQMLATAFNRNHMINNEGGRVAEESRVDYVIDRVDTTSTIWLGLTLSCAQCHDHKYDPISQREFYRFYAYFNNVAETGQIYDFQPRMPLPSEAQKQRLASLDDQLAELRAELEREPELDAEAQRAWTESVLAEAGDGEAWTLLRPESLASAEGATLMREPGHIVHVSGENPVNDTYVLTVTLPAGVTTGLRLETLTHPTFTRNGLARSDSGNFVLTEIEAELAGEKLAFAAAVADFNQGGFPPENAIDGRPDTGWAILGDINNHVNRTAVFTFAEPVEIEEPTAVTITLRHDSPHAHHNIGRFRLLATAAAEPALEQPSAPPTELVDALRQDGDARTAEQRELIAEAFAGHQRGEVQRRIEQTDQARRELRNQFTQVMIMRDRDHPRDTFVLKGGVWDQYGEKVSPATPSALHRLPEGAPANRLALARWLVSKENPLTARVTVNRYWQHFFGTGIVKTAEDFGVRAELPSHPDLLDWLAVEFRDSGWNVKHMHRLIVTSTAYQQVSRQDSHLREVDPDNRLIARGPRFRLPSHVIRDQALALAGLLIDKQGGPGVRPYQPEGIWEEVTFGQIGYSQSSGEDLYRRSLYAFWRRIASPTTFFDISDRTVCSVTPRLTNTPLHALILLNDPAYVEAARALAQRMMLEGGEAARDRLAWAFRLATAREPDDVELDVLHAGFERTRGEFAENPEAAAELVNVGESPRDESLDVVEHAAYTGVATVILNLDEVISKE